MGIDKLEEGAQNQIQIEIWRFNKKNNNLVVMICEDIEFGLVYIFIKLYCVGMDYGAQ